jgi:hypothetical protein
MTRRTRRIGPLATAVRIVVAVGLVYLAGAADGLPWNVDGYDILGGLILLPAITIILGLVARRHAAKPIRFTGPAGHAVNCAVIVALVANPYTGGAATLFYATTILAAAWRGQPGCEITVLSNWMLRRDDQVGCPVFAPIDAFETRHRARRTRRPMAAHH